MACCTSIIIFLTALWRLGSFATAALDADSAHFEVFRDDFDQDQLSLNWTVMDDVLSPLLTPPADRQNFHLRDGMLRLERGLKWNGSHIVYASRNLKTQFAFHFKYGEMTIRAKVPAIPDAVAIVALMSCTISESFTCRVPTLPSVIADLSGGPGNLMQGMVDYADSDGLAMRHFSHFNSDKAFSRDYHVHKLVWTPESLVWYMDGQWALNLTVPGLEQWPKMYIGLGIMPGFEEMASQNNATNKSLSEVFLVDYVYVRQSRGGQGLSAAAKRAVRLPVVFGTVIPTIIILAALAVGCWMHRRSRHSLQHGNMLHYGRRLRFQRRTSSLCDISGFDADIVIRDLVANPCVRLLEVPLASLQIADNVLGGSARHLFRKGCAFGLYMQTHCDAATAIAIKTGRSRNNPSVIRRLLHEIETRAKAGRHLNIVNLLGVVINGDVMLLLEYCEFGSLTTFLRGRARLAFYEKNRSDEETRKIAMSENGNPSETPTSPTLAEPKLSGLDPTALIATLIRFAYQTSRGMEFLHSRDILHRDLAARNILLFDTNVVKISHFGMAQRGPQYTLSDLQEPLPVRWMPPEAIEKRLFSQQSDVWSFSIVLWEMFSLGAMPYADAHCILKQTVGDFLTGLKSGWRLEKPAICPDFVFQLMEQCWRLSPAERSNFAELAGQLRSILEAESEESYLRLNYNYAQFNEIHRDILKNTQCELESMNGG